MTVRRVAGRERVAAAGTVTGQATIVRSVDSSSGQRQFDLQFVVDLTPLSRRVRIIAVFIRVSFDDPAARAILLKLGEARQVYAEETQQHGFGWFFGGFGGESRLGTTYVTRAVVETPADLATVTGNARVDASIARGRLRPRVQHATLREPIPLALHPEATNEAPR